ncbi:hypothetical protein Q3G72_001213 [Acer saccharum]|nr:hypothetical protein Q3G72_001213 [Acer saccharum]
MSFLRLLFLGSLPFRSRKPLPFSSIRFRRHGSSAAVDTVTDVDTLITPLQYHHHPWPEWVSFVDRLKTKGYFDVENITYNALIKECNGCNLRGFCGKADVTLKEDACTVDMMRVLLYYALDPLVVTGGEKPPGERLSMHLHGSCFRS